MLRCAALLLIFFSAVAAPPPKRARLDPQSAALAVRATASAGLSVAAAAVAAAARGAERQLDPARAAAVVVTTCATATIVRRTGPLSPRAAAAAARARPTEALSPRAAAATLVHDATSRAAAVVHDAARRASEAGAHLAGFAHGVSCAWRADAVPLHAVNAMQSHARAQLQTDRLHQAADAIQTGARLATAERNAIAASAARLIAVDTVSRALTQPSALGFMPTLARAVEENMLDVSSVRCTILNGMAETLVRGASGQKRYARNFTDGEKNFYGLLLSYGGPLVLGLVTKMIGGPAVATVKKWRHRGVKLQLGTSAPVLEHNLRAVLDILTDHGLRNASFLLAEDGTALRKRRAPCELAPLALAIALD